MRKPAKLGDRTIQMQVRLKCTRRPVWQGFFQPPHWVDATYVDKDELLDPNQSDMPTMIKAVALGLYSQPDVDLLPDYDLYTWRLTAKGEEHFRS